MPYEAALKNEGGRHPNGGEPRATMTENNQGDRRTSSVPQPKVLARKSDLSGSELKAALDFLGVPQQRLARHCGSNEVTIRRFVSGKQDGEIPLWVEWYLMMYWMHPWTRRARGRLRLPLRDWGIDRDDPDGEDESDIMAAARTERHWYSPGTDRTIRALVSSLRAIRAADQSNAHALADATLFDLGYLRDTPGNDGGTPSGATPAEPFGAVPNERDEE